MWEKFSQSVESSRIYHERYHKAVNHPKRRKILTLIAQGKSVQEIAEELKISNSELEFHLKVLEWGFCIEKDGEKIKITREGKVVEYLD